MDHPSAAKQSEVLDSVIAGIAALGILRDEQAEYM